MSERYKALHVGNRWLVIDYREPERTICLCVRYGEASEVAAALNAADETQRLRELLKRAGQAIPYRTVNAKLRDEIQAELTE